MMEAIETRQEDSEEKDVVVGWGCGEGGNGSTEVLAREWELSPYCGSTEALAALQCASYERAFADGAGLGEVRLELVADSGEVRVDGVGFDVVAHEYGIKTKRVRS